MNPALPALRFALSILAALAIVSTRLLADPTPAPTDSTATPAPSAPAIDPGPVVTPPPAAATTPAPAPIPTEAPDAASVVTAPAPNVTSEQLHLSYDLSAANVAFKQKDFALSIKILEELIDKNGYSAPLCFNLGNAELKAGLVGKAILHYERARYLDPTNANIDQNLQFARKQATLDSDSYTWWQLVIRAIPVSLWFYAVEALLILFSITILLNTFYISQLSGPTQAAAKLATRIIAFFGTPLFIFIALFATFAYASTLRDTLEAVVISKDAPLAISPTDDAEKVDVLPEGEVVTIAQKHGDYFQVFGRDKKAGWVHSGSLAPIVPGQF